MLTIPLIISIVSLSLSLFVAFRNIWMNRFNIELYQEYDVTQSFVLKSYDGRDFRASPLDEPKVKSLALARITISNNSTLPITLLAFDININQALPFVNRTHTEPYYRVSNSDTKQIGIGSPTEPIIYLKPLVRIAPFEAVQGYIMFGLNDADVIKLDKNYTLTVRTSRGNKEFNIQFRSRHEASDEFLTVEINDSSFQ